MANYDPMREQLINLAGELQKDGIKLIIGGGYGLILKAEHLRKTGKATRFSSFPDDRSTSDIDAFLSAEIITDPDKTNKVKAALDMLGYQPVAKYFQFAISISETNPDLKVRFDFLAAPPANEEARQLVKIGKPRIRPKGSDKMHGFLTEEAITLEENLVVVRLKEDPETLEVFLPHPFTYLVLKLFALHDRLEDEKKDFGAYHAFDIYRVIAMMTEEEWEQACEMRDKFAGETKIQEARRIVGELFSNDQSLGVLRTKQHAKSVGTELLSENLLAMCKDLAELFPSALCVNNDETLSAR